MLSAEAFNPHPIDCLEGPERRADCLGQEVARIGRGVAWKASCSFWLIACTLATLAAGKAFWIDSIHPDCFWHLRVAEQLMTDGIGPLVDRLSFASTQTPWSPYSWLAELGMKAVWDAGGYRWALASQAAMLAAIVLLVAAQCRVIRSAGNRRDRFAPLLPSGLARTERFTPVPLPAMALAVCGAVILAVPHLSFRPSTAALLCLALGMSLIVRDRSNGERTLAVWACPPVAALCVNLHLYAVFLAAWLGLLLLAACWERVIVAERPELPEADRRVSRYLWLTIATAGGCCCTPMLPGMISTAVHYARTDPMVAGGFLAEMRPFFDGPFGVPSLVVVALALILVLLRLNQFRVGERLLLAASVAMLAQWGRLAAVFALVVLPMAAVALPRFNDTWTARLSVRLASAAALLTATAWAVAGFPAAQEPLSERISRPTFDAPAYPVIAARYVKSHVANQTGRLISEFDWGGYLEWTLGDQYQLFLDGRTQLFTPEFWKATYLGSEADRERFLANVHADAAIVPARSSLFRHALVQAGWRSAYRDDAAEVLVPPPPPVATTPPPPERWSIGSILP